MAHRTHCGEPYPCYFVRPDMGQSRLVAQACQELTMLVLIQWQGCGIAVPLSQQAAINSDQSTNEVIRDWRYWIAQGYCF